MTTDAKRRAKPLWMVLFLRNKKAMVGLGMLAAFLLMALLGSTLAPFDPSDFVADPDQAPSLEHWFGTTGQGQDVFSQTLVGSQLSLAVAFGAGFCVVAISAVVGTAAGYFGGFIDDVLSLLTNVFLIMPGLPLAVVLAAYLPAGPLTIAFVLIFTGWAWNARVVRAQTLSLREKDFVLAAVVSGESSLRIILREIIPNMTSILVSAFIGATVYAIGAQVGLEFLGLGDVAQVTWGTNLYWATKDAALLKGAWWTFLPTGLSVALVGTALALINFAIDEISNPRLRAESDTRRATRAHGAVPRGMTPVLRSRPAAVENEASPAP